MTKYLPEYDQIAYRIIALSGKNAAACQSLGVSSRVFCIWLKSRESFRIAVEQGHEFYDRASAEVRRIALLNYISEILENRGEIVRTTRTAVVRQVWRDRHNQVTSVLDTETTIETVQHKGIPKWVADKIMTNASGLNEAIVTVIAAGLEVYHPNTFQEQGSRFFDKV